MVSQLEGARKMKPLARALYRLGQLHEAQGERVEAMSAYERTRKADATAATELGDFLGGRLPAEWNAAIPTFAIPATSAVATA